MKSFAIYLSCFLIAMTLSFPTARMINATKDKPAEPIVVTEEKRQVIYAPRPIVEATEKIIYAEYFIRNPYKAFEADIEQICDIEADESEEEYLAAPEIEFQPFTTYVYNGTRKKLPASEHLQWIVCETAERYDLPYRVVLALLGSETTWKENADHVETHDGARYIGIGCISEKHHASDMAKRGIDIYTLNGNIEAVCWLLKAQYDRFGTIELALMAYNGGAGYAKGQIECGVTENSYSQKVLRYAESFE